MLKKLWPARTNKETEGPVADLDAIVAAPVPFRFKGKVHILKPFSLAEYLKFVGAKNGLEQSMKGGTITPKELAKSYHAVIAAVCDTITVEDILSMEQVQIAALYQLVIDMVTGQVDTGEGKKKRLRVDLYESVQHSSSQNAQENLDGTPKPH